MIHHLDEQKKIIYVTGIQINNSNDTLDFYFFMQIYNKKICTLTLAYLHFHYSFDRVEPIEPKSWTNYRETLISWFSLLLVFIIPQYFF